MLNRLLKCTPIAWLQVTNQPTKMAVAVAGVCFSNVLIFFQLGLMDSLYNSQRKPIETMQSDLFMVSSKYVNLSSLVTFQRNRLYQMMGVQGVKTVSPLRIGRSRWLNPSTQKNYDIYIYGINPVFPSFDLPEVIKNESRLNQLRTALFDRRSKKQYGDVFATIQRDGVFKTEVQGHQLNVIDTFAMGATFAADANLICGESTFLYLFPEAVPEQIQVGLIKLAPGAAAESVQASARTVLRDDVQLLTKKEFSALELKYWKKNSSVGFISASV